MTRANLPPAVPAWHWPTLFVTEMASSPSRAALPPADTFEELLATGAATPEQLGAWCAAHFHLPRWEGVVSLDSALPFAAQVPFEFARDHLLLPLVRRTTPEGRTTVRCLTAQPWHWQALDNLSLLLEAPLDLVLGTEAQLRAAIGQVYQQQLAQAGSLQQATADSAQAAPTPRGDVALELQRLSDRDLLAKGDKEPIARLLDTLLFDALQKRASDLHVHPYPDHLQIRYRIDGVLHNAFQPPLHLQEQLVGRIKVLAGLDVAEKRLPQDGRSSVQIGPRAIDLRVSTVPTTCGERVVLRLLEQTARLQELGELGMPPALETPFREALQRSHGLLLVTGPTGSGKTTTLYSALAQLDSTQKNILTLEDPVEYRLAGISQIPVAAKKGLSFASGLRHVLRQDPDIILIGEVRDEPTARMVIQSSLTGHLVLTTLHTNSAAGAIARLADLGIEPYLIASSLLGVLAQRLVRTLCPACAGAAAAPVEFAPAPAAGCPQCHGTGFAGRTGIYEWLPATQRLREQILHDVNATHLEALGREEGMRTLAEEGLRLVAAGSTSRAELLRVLGTPEEREP